MFMDSKILHEYVLTFHKYRTLIVPCKYALICNPLDCKFCEAMVVSDCVKNPLIFKFLYYARSSWSMGVNLPTKLQKTKLWQYQEAVHVLA